MLHHKRGRKLKRGRAQNRALLQGLASSLISKGRIKTTQARAKELRPFIETLVTRARKDTLAGNRIVITRLGSKVLAKKLINDIAPAYKKRPGGYTRIVKAVPRAGDGAKQAYIEFVK